jgi:hypothetical protein
MRILYDFYFSTTVQSIAKRHGFAPLPSFIATVITNVLVNSVKCSDGTYALADLMTTTVTNIAITSFMKPSLNIYLPVYQALDSSTTFNLVNTDLSTHAWNNFVTNPNTYGSAFTYFSSSSKKISEYSQLKGRVLTSAFVHVPVVVGESRHNLLKIRLI